MTAVFSLIFTAVLIIFTAHMKKRIERELRFSNSTRNEKWNWIMKIFRR